MRLFRDRDDAGRRLAEIIKRRGYERAVVLGIPRGGVATAVHVARALNADLGVVVARKLRAPHQPELAIGAVTAGGVAWVNEELAEATGASSAYLEREQAEQAAEAARREATFDGGARPSLAGRPVIVVDDGVATGATVVAAVKAVRAAGAGPVIVAVPVGPPRTLEQLRALADEVVALDEVEDFYSVGQFYTDFAQLADADVQKILEGYRRSTGKGDRVVRTARITRGPGELAAKVVLPGGGGQRPVVVFVHGLGSSKDSPRNVVIAERVVDAGMAVVLFDLSGHGESTVPGSTVAEFAADLGAVVAWIAGQPELDAQRIGVSGSSFGGLAVVEAVRRKLVDPTAIVLRAPPVTPGTLEGFGEETLVIAGEADPLLAGIEQAVRATPSVALSLVPGAGHLFEEPGTLDRATDLTVAWFERLLRGGAGAATGEAMRADAR